MRPNTVRPCLMLVLALAATGCAGGAEDWSTKGQSIQKTPPPIEQVDLRPESRQQAWSQIPTHKEQASAIDLLQQAAIDQRPILRANALEGLLPSPSSLEPLVRRSLVDPNRGVRFIALMCMADAGLCEDIRLVEPMLEDPSMSVQAAAIYCLDACDIPVDPSRLASFALSDEPEVRSNAITILGLLGNSSAVGLVEASIAQGLGQINPERVKLFELQASAALVRLGEVEGLEPIRAALFAPMEQGELTVLACQLLAELGDLQAQPMLERLVEAEGKVARPIEIRLAAADSLIRLGAQPGEPTMQLIQESANSDIDSIRAQAILALGHLGSARALDLVQARLDDPSPLVQIAAASAMLNISSSSGS